MTNFYLSKKITDNYIKYEKQILTQQTVINVNKNLVRNWRNLIRNEVKGITGVKHENQKYKNSKLCSYIRHNFIM